MNRCFWPLAFVPLLIAAGPVTSVKLPVTRDTWVSNVGKEADGSNGGAPQLKVKSIQEMSLIDIDAAAIKGRMVVRAALHVHLSGPEILRRVTVSSVGAGLGRRRCDGIRAAPRRIDFQSSAASGYAMGVSRQQPDLGHSEPGRYDLALGRCNSAGRGPLAGSAGRSHRHRSSCGGHQRRLPRFRRHRERMVPRRRPLHPAKLSQSLLPQSRFTPGDGALYDNRTGRGRYAAARSADRPEIRMRTCRRARRSVSWATPADAGKAGVIGFFVDIDGKPVPRYLIPVAGKDGLRVTMHLRDLGLAAGQTVNVSVRAVDGAGNMGPAATLSVKTSDESLTPLPGKNGEPFKGNGPLPKLGGAEIAIIDALDKVQPVTGEMIPPQKPSYLAANHLWDGRQIHLFAARNEVVSFQILVRGKVQDVSAKLSFDSDKGADGQLDDCVRFYSCRNVSSKVGPVPDPLMPVTLRKPMLSIPDPDAGISGQTSGSLLCEISVPDLPAGQKAGMLTLSAEGHELKIPVVLKVWDFSLPDSLSFLPEMNCYDLPDNEGDYYRLAHRNRVVLNRVPYHQSGSMSPGCAAGVGSQNAQAGLGCVGRAIRKVFRWLGVQRGIAKGRAAGTVLSPAL